MNLYIFNETRRGAVFGVGTYIRELTFALQNRSLHICIINLLSDKPYIQMEKIENIEHWYFPSPIPEQRTSDSQKQRALYFRNVVYLLQLHIKDKKKIILFAGRIDEIKGVSSLIKAFHLVLEAYPNSRLLIAGNGDYTRAFQEAKNIYTKITFTGLLKKEELFEIYQLADAGVVPSLFEPFGYVPVEMMMHELPIIATTTSGLNEVVDESCGLKVPLIVSPDNVEIDTSLLAQKIVYLLQSPEEAKRLGKNGRKRYLEKYSSEVFGKNMIEFYKSLFQECK